MKPYRICSDISSFLLATFIFGKFYCRFLPKFEIFDFIFMDKLIMSFLLCLGILFFQISCLFYILEITTCNNDNSDV